MPGDLPGPGLGRLEGEHLGGGRDHEVVAPKKARTAWLHSVRMVESAVTSAADSFSPVSIS